MFANSSRNPTPSSRERRTSASAPRSVRPLLVSRKDAGYLLGGVDVSTIRRMEKAGLLTPVRLNPRSATGSVYFRYDDIVAYVASLQGRR